MQVWQRVSGSQLLLASLCLTLFSLHCTFCKGQEGNLLESREGRETGWLDPVSLRQSAHPGRLAVAGNHSLTLTAEPYQCVGTWFTTVSDTAYQLRLDSATLDPSCDQAWHWALLSDANAILGDEGATTGQQECHVDELSRIPPPIIGLCPRSRLHGSFNPYYLTSEDVEEDGPGVSGFVFDPLKLRNRNASSDSSCGMSLVPGAANVDVIMYLSNRCSNTTSVKIRIVVEPTRTAQDEGFLTKGGVDNHAEDAEDDGNEAKRMVMYFIVTLITAPAMACVCGACVAATCYSFRTRGAAPAIRGSVEQSPRSTRGRWDPEGSRDGQCARNPYSIPMMVAVVEIQDMEISRECEVVESQAVEEAETEISLTHKSAELPLSTSAPTAASGREIDVGEDAGDTDARV